MEMPQHGWGNPNREHRRPARLSDLAIEDLSPYNKPSSAKTWRQECRRCFGLDRFGFSFMPAIAMNLLMFTSNVTTKWRSSGLIRSD